MFKKMMFVGLLACALPVLIGGLLLGRPLLSYVGTAFSEVKTDAKDLVPVEWELKRARNMIGKLDPVIRDNRTKIVREEIDVAKLDRQINQNEELLTKNRDEIFRLRDDLDSSETHYVYAGRQYTESQVRADLANRFKHYQTLEATTGKLKKIVDIRRNKLTAARVKVEEMLSAKRQLEVDVENLDARLEMIRVAEASSEFSFDNNKLAQTREVVEDITTRLDVTERMLNTKIELYDRIPLEGDHESLGTITDDVTAYFYGAPSRDVASTDRP